MIASTSRDAHRAHQSSGKLGEQQRQLMLWFHGKHRDLDVTRAELAQATGLRLSSVCGRVFELLDAGYLEETARRRCTITGSSAHALRIARPKVPQQLSLIEASA